jgi:GntR family transcriptional regulator
MFLQRGEGVVGMKFDLSKPIYQQIIDEIKRAVARGELKPGDKLPSHREMSQQVKVNPNTIQRAYREMEQLDLVTTLKGQGTFICDNVKLLGQIRYEMAEKALSVFVTEMKSLGFQGEEIFDLVAGTLKRAADPTENDSTGNGVITDEGK